MCRTIHLVPGLDTVVPLVRTGVRGRGTSTRADLVLQADDPSAPIIDRLVGPLIVLYAFDQDDGFHLVGNIDLPLLGVDRAALAAAARDNLIDRMGDLKLLERPDGCGMVRLDGNLEASVVLIPQLWHDIADILQDEVIIAVPARDVVLFCGAGNAAARPALEAARDRVLAVGDHQITADLFRFSGGSWQIEPG